MRILIVEDEKDQIELLSMIIKRKLPFALEIISAESCESAKEELSKMAFDLITIDGRLSDGCGLDLIAKAKEAHAVVIMISGHAEFASIAIETGADAFISKSSRMANQIAKTLMSFMQQDHLEE